MLLPISAREVHPHPMGRSPFNGLVCNRFCHILFHLLQLFPGAVRAEISPTDNSGDVQLSPARHGITHRSCRFPGDLWASESPCYASCFSRSLVCQHLRAEKNRHCHFLVTKRPQLKRYPRLVELYFRKLVRNNFFVARWPLIFTKSLRMPDWKSAVP